MSPYSAGMEPDQLNRLSTTVRLLAALTGWGVLLFIAFATLGPIATRPHIAGIGVDLERFLAFFCLAGALCFAYPKHRVRIALLIAAVAIGLEIAQLFEIERHGRPHDALVKLIGILTGAGCAALVDDMARRFREILLRRVKQI